MSGFTPGRIRSDLLAMGIGEEMANLASYAAGLRRAARTQAGAPTAEQWLGLHASDLSIMHEQALSIRDLTWQRKYNVVVRVLSKNNNATRQQIYDLPRSVQTLLTDLAYVGNPFRARIPQLRSLVHQWYGGNGQVASEKKMLVDIRSIIDNLPTELQGANGRSIRLSAIDHRLAELEPPSPMSSSGGGGEQKETKAHDGS